MEEIDHIQREISQPSIEDLVLITQLHGVVRNLLKSREKHAVQVATLQKHCEHQEQSRLFLNQVHALLSETVKNLESSQGKNHVPWKEVARTRMILLTKAASSPALGLQKDDGQLQMRALNRVKNCLRRWCAWQLNWKMYAWSSIGKCSLVIML
jgi:hypothetical protein